MEDVPTTVEVEEPKQEVVDIKQKKLPKKKKTVGKKEEVKLTPDGIQNSINSPKIFLPPSKKHPKKKEIGTTTRLSIVKNW